MADYKIWDNDLEVDYGFENSENIFQIIANFISELQQEKIDNSNADSYSALINGVTSDSNTIFGSAAQTKEQLMTFVNSINGSGTSTISIHVGSTVFYGKEVGNRTYQISNSWYAPFKSTSDSIISAFIWLSFVFSLFRNLGSIIEGNGMRIKTILAKRGDSSGD